LSARLRKEVLALPGAKELCGQIVERSKNEVLLRKRLMSKKSSTEVDRKQEEEVVVDGEGGDETESREKANAEAPEVAENGHNVVKIGVGCEIGRHRSVSLVVEAAKLLRKEGIVVLEPIHRDIEANKSSASKNARGKRRGGKGKFHER